MNRRVLLAAVGTSLVSLSGCTAPSETAEPASKTAIDEGGGNEYDGGNNGRTETTASRDDAADTRRTVSVEQVESVPDDVPIEWGVTVSERAITKDQTARLEVSVTNAGESARRMSVPYYKETSSLVGEPGLLLHSERAPDTPSDEDVLRCLTDENDRRGRYVFTAEGRPRLELEPGETVTDEFVVSSDPAAEECFPTGTYRFERPQTTGDDDGNRADEFSWGFTLRISD